MNDRIDDARCFATTYVTRLRINAASAKREKRMTAMSASCQFATRAAKVGYRKFAPGGRGCAFRGDPPIDSDLIRPPVPI